MRLNHVLLFGLLSLLFGCFHDEQTEPALTLLDTLPKASSPSISVGTDIQLEFNKPVDYQKAVAYVDGMRVSSFRYGNTAKTILTLRPVEPLQPNRQYKVKLESVGALDSSETISNIEWSFETGDRRYLENISQLTGATSGNFCAIDDNAGLMCWGNGDSIPKKIVADNSSGWKKVAMNKSLSCGISLEGNIWCWGYSRGDPTRVDLEPNTAFEVLRKLAGETKWTTLTVGHSDTYAVTADGGLYCWGDDLCRKLGKPDAAMGSAAVKIAIPVNETGWVDVFASPGEFNYSRICAISTTGSLWCAGNSWSGAVGDGTSNDAKSMTRTGDRVDWTKTILSDFTTCGLTKDGQWWCWGGGFLLAETITQSATESLPTRVYSELKWRDITINLSSARVCGVDEGGSVYCYSRYSKSVETQIDATDLLRWRSIHTSLTSTCALTESKQVYCWGENDSGSLGQGKLREVNRPYQIVTHSDATWSNVVASYETTCAFGLASEELWCSGTIASETLREKRVSNFTEIPDAEPWLNSSGNFYGNSFCGISRNSPGKVFCKERNYTSGYSLVEKLDISPQKISAIKSSHGRHCALSDDGRIWCWYDSPEAQLEFDPSTAAVDLLVPASVSDNGEKLPWIDVSISDEVGCAINSRNAMYCCGYIRQEERKIPQIQFSESRWKSMTVGRYVSEGCAIDINDHLWCWGEKTPRNSNSERFGYVPVQVTFGDSLTWKQVSSGPDKTCAIDTSNNLWCWGMNILAGLGVATDKLVAQRIVQVPAPSETIKWDQVFASSSVCALATDQSLWCWGNNRDGEIGGDTAFSTTPLRVVAP